MLHCPVKSPCRITQVFGENPKIYSQFGLKGHNGIDFTGPEKGVPVAIYSAIEGYVYEIGNQGKAGYGKYVRVRSHSPDDRGRLKETIYAHLSDITVKQGQFMPMGDKVGIMGNTGFSTALHLHFGLRFLNTIGKVLDAGNGYSGYIDCLPYIRFWVDKPELSSLVTYV